MRPILFSALGFSVASSPVFCGLAALAAYLYFERRRDRLALSELDFWGLILCLAVGVFAASVLFYAAAYGRGWTGSLSYLWSHHEPVGGSFLGTYLGAALAAWAYCRARGLRFAPVGDCLGAATLLGLSIMKLGCLFNGCCYGRPTTLAWGLVFTGRCGVPQALRGIPLQPTQICESLGSLAIFLFLDRVLLPRIERGRLRPGSALAASAGFYAVLRFFVDFLRGTGPGRYSLPGLTLAQTLALPAMLLSAAWLRLRDE